MQSRSLLSRPLMPPQTQAGIALVISMIFLIALTLLALSAMRSTVLEEKMAGNSRDWTIALNAAEAALRDAERDIETSNRIVGKTGFNSDCTDGMCLDNSRIQNYVSSQNDWLIGSTGGLSVVYGTHTNANPPTIPGVAAQPRYLIEYMNAPGASMVVGKSKKYAYRITARGFGASVDANGNPIARVTLQSTYTKISN